MTSPVEMAGMGNNSPAASNGQSGSGTSDLFGSQYDREAAQGFGKLMTVFVPSTGAFETLNFIIGMFWFVLLGLTLPVEIWVRSRQGIRYMSLTRFYLSLSIAATVVLLMSVFSLLVGGSIGWGWLLFSFPTVIFFIVQYVKNLRRYKRGERWHSFSTGISRFEHIADKLRRANERWNLGIPYLDALNDWFFLRWVDPGYVLFLSLPMMVIDPILGIYFLLAGFSLLIQNQISYSRMWNRILDLEDGKIEGMYIQAAIEGAHKSQTGGLSVVGLASLKGSRTLPTTTSPPARPASPSSLEDAVSDTLSPSSP